MLKYLLIPSFLVTLLIAANPIAYSQLGDEIYNSVSSYKKMTKTLPQMNSIINNYIKGIKKTKELGYKVESKPKLSKDYLLSLRELDKKRQVILTKLNAMLYRSMDMNDAKTFKKILHSGLIDFDKVADDVIPFYKRNFRSGSIKEIDYLIKNEKRYKIDAKKANKEYAKRLEQKRINRMRNAAKELDATREAKLDSQVDKERTKIKKMMNSELIR